MNKILIILALVLMPAMAFAAQGSAVKYEVGGQPYEGYYISPAPGAPLVLMIHDWDGLTDYEVKRAAMLADLGYAVFAADLYGAGVRPTEVKDKKRLTGSLYKDRAAMRARMDGALAKAGALGANVNNSVVIGYCFGGAAALEMARSGAPLKAFVSFHGGLVTPDGQDYSRTKGEVVVFHGTADAAVSMEQFATLAKELETAGLTHEMATYSGAPHAFTVFGSKRYHKEADRKSWARFVEYLSETLQ